VFEVGRKHGMREQASGLLILAQLDACNWRTFPHCARLDWSVSAGNTRKGLCVLAIHGSGEHCQTDS
jgi:hypothetical protein